MRAVQIYVGLGAGNIGDELMMRAAWQCLPDELVLDVPLASEAARQHAAYPPPHHYIELEDERALAPGLLVGATPVTSAEGLEWPLGALTPRIDAFHGKGLPVDAAGVGVDRLEDPAARALFAGALARVRSWTVRSEACAAALADLGVPPQSVRVGADWAWLYRPGSAHRNWARAVWQRSGVDTARPLLVVNAVNMLWRGEAAARRALAAGLSNAARKFGLQVAFFANECRAGEFYDHAAAGELGALLDVPYSILPNEYYSPDETLALLSPATATLGARYHFLVESVLAGSVPVGILRGPKMRGLASDLPFPLAGTVERIECSEVVAGVSDAIENRSSWRQLLEARQFALARRALNNLSFLRELDPYCGLRWPQEH